MVQDIRIRFQSDTTDLAGAKKALAGISDEEKKIADGFKNVNKESSKTAGVLKDQFQNVGSVAKGVGAAILASFALDSVTSFGKKIIETTAQFQKLQSVLNNSLGKTGGQQAFSLIQQFAAETNFSVLELTQSFVKLANQGFQPTRNQLRQLADLANSTGKSFDQLAEAIIDAQTGEFERLKEFGIRAKKEGDNVRFTFKGVETQVKNTSEAITGYITSLGDLEGVTGSTTAISQTLEGQISNLGDSFDNLFNTIGEGSTGVITFAISKLKEYVDFVAFALKSTEQVRKETAQGFADETLQTYKEFTPALREALYANLLAQEESAQDEIKVQEKKVEELRQLLLFSNDYINKSTNEYNLKQAQARLDDLQRTKLYVTTKLDYIDEYAKKEAEVATKATVPQLGLLESLRAKLKELREAQEKAFTPAAITAFGNQIEEVELKIRNLLEGLKDQNFFKGLNDEIQATNLQLLRNSAVIVATNEEATEKRKTLAQQASDFIRKLSTEDNKALAENSKRFLENFKADEELKKELSKATFDFINDAAAAAFEFGSQKRDQQLADIEAKEQAELQRVGDNEQAKDFIRKKYAEEERRVKQRQAQADKNQAIFQILVSTAMAVAKANPVIPLMAFAAATGALQLALVASRPIPKFARGTEHLNGKPGTDTNLIWADTGERIIDKHTNRKLKGIKNRELPRLVELGKLALNQTYNNDPAIVKELQMLRGDFRNQPKEITNIDEYGISRFSYTQNMRKQKLNKRFSW